jgi:hypothetical protein
LSQAGASAIICFDLRSVTTQLVFSAQHGIVAQICNLPYRRFVIGRASESSSPLALAGKLQNEFCDTADYKSALR